MNGVPAHDDQNHGDGCGERDALNQIWHEIRAEKTRELAVGFIPLVFHATTETKRNVLESLHVNVGVGRVAVSEHVLPKVAIQNHGVVHVVREPNDLDASGEVITADPLHLGLVDIGLGLVLGLGLLLGLGKTLHRNRLHGRRRANPVGLPIGHDVDDRRLVLVGHESVARCVTLADGRRSSVARRLARGRKLGVVLGLGEDRSL